MAIQIEQIVQVLAPWMAIGVVLRETKMVDGHLYVKAMKTDDRIFRLIVGSSRVRDSAQLSAKVRHLIDHLTTMRDNQRQLYIQSLLDDGDALEFDNDKVFKKQMKKLQHLVPDVLPLELPRLQTPLKVLSNTDALWIELSARSIQWLHDEVVPQAAELQPPMEQPQQLKKPVWVSSRDAYRCQFIEDGVIKTKDFHVVDDTNESKEAAWNAASEWWSNHM